MYEVAMMSIDFCIVVKVIVMNIVCSHCKHYCTVIVHGNFVNTCATD